MESVSRSIARKEVVLVILKLPTKRRPGQHGFTGECFSTLKEDLPTKKLITVFTNSSKEGILSHSFHKTRTTLIPNPDKDRKL